MKKIRLFSVTFAIAISGTAVFASTLDYPKFYRAATPGGADGADCTTEIIDPGCPGGNVQCRKTFAGGVIYRISVKLSATEPCVMAMMQGS